MVNFKNDSSQFLSILNYPNWVGSIDGKHTRIKSPPPLKSLCYNYRVLRVDEECKFTAIDVSSYGKGGDAGIYLKRKLGKRYEIIHSTLPVTDIVESHVIVGDKAFVLCSKTWLNLSQDSNLF